MKENLSKAASDMKDRHDFQINEKSKMLLSNKQKKDKKDAISALIIVDIQNDFCHGSMAIDDAASIIPKINSIRRSGKFKHIFRTRDWHPRDHVSFQSNNPGSVLFENFTIKENGEEQIMWPDHCIKGTVGAQYHKDLELGKGDFEISKGTKKMVDAFSAFGSDHEDTGLYTKLVDLGVTHVYCVGLAYDFCVGYTAQDAAEEGFETYVIKDATVSVNPEDEEFINERYQESGVMVIDSKDL